jgi:hypothetical protein
MSGWELADRATYEAYQSGKKLLLFAQGSKPSVCHEVDLDQVREDAVEIPTFVLRWRVLGVCSPDETPYEYGEVFPCESRPKEVVVHDKKGQARVPVKRMEPNSMVRRMGSTAPTTSLGPVGRRDHDRFFLDVRADAVARTDDWNWIHEDIADAPLPLFPHSKTINLKLGDGPVVITETDQEVVKHEGDATWTFHRISEKEVEWRLYSPPDPIFGNHRIHLRMKARYGVK